MVFAQRTSLKLTVQNKHGGVYEQVQQTDANASLDRSQSSPPSPSASSTSSTPWIMNTINLQCIRGSVLMISLCIPLAISWTFSFGPIALAASNSLLPFAGLSVVFIYWRRIRYRFKFLAALLVTMALSMFAGVLTLSYFSHWCVFRPRSINELCEMAVDAQTVLDQADIRAYLYRGSLLGYVRNGQHIKWEHDFDVCIDSRDIDAVSQAMLSDENMNAKYLVESHTNEKGVVNRVRIHIGDEWRRKYIGHSGSPMWETWQCEMPEDLRQVDFCGGRFWVPRNADNVLRPLYGADYLTPKFTNHWAMCEFWLDDYGF